MSVRHQLSRVHEIFALQSGTRESQVHSQRRRRRFFLRFQRRRTTERRTRITMNNRTGSSKSEEEKRNVWTLTISLCTAILEGNTSHQHHKTIRWLQTTDEEEKKQTHQQPQITSKLSPLVTTQSPVSGIEKTVFSLATRYFPCTLRPTPPPTMKKTMNTVEWIPRRTNKIRNNYL